MQAEPFFKLSKASAVSVRCCVRASESKRNNFFLEALLCTDVEQPCREKSITEVAEEESPDSQRVEDMAIMIANMIKNIYFIKLYFKVLVEMKMFTPVPVFVHLWDKHAFLWVPGDNLMAFGKHR